MQLCIRMIQQLTWDKLQFGLVSQVLIFNFFFVFLYVAVGDRGLQHVQYVSMLGVHKLFCVTSRYIMFISMYNHVDEMAIKQSS